MIDTQFTYINSKGEESLKEVCVTKINDTHLWGIDLATDRPKQFRIDRISDPLIPLDMLPIGLLANKIDKIIDSLNTVEIEFLRNRLEYDHPKQ